MKATQAANSPCKKVSFAYLITKYYLIFFLIATLNANIYIYHELENVVNLRKKLDNVYKLELI